jgi:serine/threonine protein kinase/Tol biopolymer transport system component
VTLHREAWRRLKEAFEGARALAVDARPAYLAEACHGDEALRREVELLLAHGDQAASFLETPAMPFDDSPVAKSLEGQCIGPYQVSALIGTGGMGEVYSARDTKLNRLVAIKVLLPDLANDPGRLGRFGREAQLLASLNHPHIAQIHGFENAGGVHALVMELVEGQTLADRIALGAIPIDEALAIAKQIAEALEAAHEQGIIHRDLKPANIKVREDGTVKVLDFGLAKALDSPSSTSVNAMSSPAPDVRATEAGVILGTAAYMSPEQARGRPVDKRTDIWAFGCVLYEMLTGRLPFIGETPSDTMVAILERTPDWSALPPATPAPVRRLLLRSLDKDVKHRLRDIGDARAEIDDALGGAMTSATPIIHRRTKLPRLAWSVAGVSGVLVLAGLVAVVVWERDPIWTNPLEGAQFGRLTNFEGSEIDASVSADGKLVVFISDRDGPFDAWVTQVGTGEFKNLTTGRFPNLGSESTRNAGFSADASKVWLAIPDGQDGFDDWLVPTIGGAARRFVARGVEMAWSPDGGMLAYHEFGAGDPIFIADRDAGNPRRIFIDKPGVHCHYLTWSPDGRYIYFVKGQAATQGMDIWRVAVSGGDPERITQHQTSVASPTPLDNRTLLYTSLADDGSGPWLYAVDVQQKISRRISLGVEQYRSISATADGRRLVAWVGNPTGHLWSLPILDRPAAEVDAAQLSLPNVRAVNPSTGPNYLLYHASQGGGDGIWKSDNGAALELWKGSEGGVTSAPAVSTDGRRISFTVRRQAQGRLYVMNSDGTGVRTVGAPLNFGGVPSWSPDGTSIGVVAYTAEGSRVFKVPVDGGTPVQLFDGVASHPLWSPDGRIVLYSGPNVGGQATVKAVTPEGTPVPIPKVSVRFGDGYRFLPDGTGLVFMRGGSAKVKDFYLLDLVTGQERRLSNLKPGFSMQHFDVSSDGKRIIFDRRRDNSDIVLIDLKGK